MDYYKVLGVPNNSSIADVVKAYRKLSLKWHPKLSKASHSRTLDEFCKIS